jgi:hypothetical protein
MMRISELEARELEIEERLRELLPVRAKGDGPIVYEDYTGELGKEKHAEWEDLMLERGQLRRLSRQWEMELTSPARSG